MWFVYVLRDPRDRRIRYCGQSTLTPARRLAAHVHEALTRHKSGRYRYNNHRVHWLRALLRTRLLPTIHVVQRGRDDVAAIERLWIARLRASGCDLVNNTDGGEGGAGRKITAHALQNYRAANRGERNPRATITDATATLIAQAVAAARRPSGRLPRGALIRIAQQHGVGRELVRTIAIGRAWRHVTK